LGLGPRIRRKSRSETRNTLFPKEEALQAPVRITHVSERAAPLCPVDTPRCVGGNNDWPAKKTRRPRTKQLSTRPRVFGPDTRVESDFVLSFRVSLPVVACALASRCAQRRGVYGRNTRVPRVLGHGAREQGFVKPPFGGTRRLRIRLRLPVYSVS
jgi:hypothetical protein